MRESTSNLQELANSIRGLAMDAVQAANSGHPGMPLGCADIAAVLFTEHLRFNPSDDRWLGRDRFVLSAGHGSMLLYSVLHLFGYDLSLEEIKNFRQWDSKTPGHPEFGLTAGVETTTGPLGQGFANGLGLALGGRALQARYDKSLFDYLVYAIVSDGDLMEGVASEAASLAGHLGLGNLIYLYDDNEISIGGNTDITFTEDVPARFKSYGWHVLDVDGHDYEAIDQAITAAKAETSKPSLIVTHTTIAKGSPNLAGSEHSHGSPLGEEEVAATKAALGLDPEKHFQISDSVAALCKKRAEDLKPVYDKWQSDFETWKGSNAALASTLELQKTREIPSDLAAALHAELDPTEKEATRATSGRALQIIAEKVPFLIGGSADLEPSTKTLIKSDGDITPEDFGQRNIRFGVREHAMGSLVNGLAYEQMWFPYTATFLVFSDYMRPTIRLAALSHLQSLFIFTHDSFWVGEDGPTHQPIEHADALRLIPNNYVFRPADGCEVAASYISALNLKSAPSCMLFTRQGLEQLEYNGDDRASLAARGGYILEGMEVSDRVVVATGSETRTAQLAVNQFTAKTGKTVRVVSMPCLELFSDQDQSYKDSVIPVTAEKVVIEAGPCTTLKAFLGDNTRAIGMERFGASAPGGELAKQFGFTPDAIAEKLESLFA